MCRRKRRHLCVERQRKTSLSPSTLSSKRRSPSSRRSSAGAAKPDSPKTVLDGSSVLSTDGGIPVNYEEGELEDEGASSSLSHDSKPAAGTRRPREDDLDTLSSKRPQSISDAVPSRLEALAITSEQRDVMRTDGSVHEPWMPSESVITARHGCTVPPNEIPLYVDNRIADDAEAASKHFEPMANQRRDYYISLFHELRYWSSKMTSGQSRVPEWLALCQTWNQFVENFNKDSTGYRERIVSAREGFMKYSITSGVQRVHEGSVNANIPCAVPVGINCPHCSPGATRISERDRTGYTTNWVPANVKELRAKLACTRQHPTQHPAVLRLQSVVDFVRLHHFQNVRHQDVTGKPRISKETRLSPTNTKTNRISVRLRTGMVNNPIYLAVDRAADRVMLLSSVPDAHHMVNPRLTTVFRRSTLAWRLLSARKASVAEAAQTTSNIRVEVSEQVRLLQEKVKRLEEKLRTRRASSLASHHD
ncbi:hypothetical protein PHMEG_00027318 [Phytophthora megakarya]|uniref:Uncharacterized protein n=1 Tax=Phytophthora megakarya TaxID=4795 RepID=A0A225V8K5_9STRA|nr:hypothetical protein PHMEG_00027318 [Phytophthora megakarya]